MQWWNFHMQRELYLGQVRWQVGSPSQFELTTVPDIWILQPCQELAPRHLASWHALATSSAYTCMWDPPVQTSLPHLSCQCAAVTAAITEMSSTCSIEDVILNTQIKTYFTSHFTSAASGTTKSKANSWVIAIVSFALEPCANTQGQICKSVMSLQLIMR